MTQKKTHTLSLLAALTSAVIFGMSFMFSKLALEVAAPTVLLAFRFTVAVAAMSLVILVNALVGKLRGRPLFAFSLRGKPVYKLVLLGIVQPVAYFIFENYGILYTSSAVAGTIIAAVPVCCILMDVLVLHERVTLKQVLCALGAIGGVALISVGGAMMVSALGMLFLVLTMLSDTLYYGISHSAAKRFTPFEMTYVMFIVGMVVFIPVGLIYAGGLHSPLITGPMHDGGFWVAVLYLGLLSSVLAYGLLNFANSHLSVSETSLFSNVTTVVSVLAGVVLLKEPFSVWQMLGVAVILVCVFVANVSGGKES
jgi:drug/metabolite transporter (DMT)-like permease